ARPYVASAKYPDERRSVKRLGDRIAAIRAKDADGRRKLPNKMLHELREGLFLGTAAARTRVQLVLNRYGDLKTLLENEELFWSVREKNERDESVEVQMTALLDAMDLSEFWTEDKS